MKPARLNVCQLESREVPATFGIPWASPDTLTISFVPDGTQVDGVASNLFANMAASGMSTSVWQGEILRAFQAWSDSTNINFSISADSGANLGASGVLQGDTRFGDIRIAARTLSNNVLAITTPSGNGTGTRAGDIVLNSKYIFSLGTSGYNLNAVMLQEAGHAVGIGNSSDPASVMYEYYQGARTGLGASDVASIEGLYGKRNYNMFEWFGNNTSLMASSITRGSGVAETTTLRSFADLGTTSDVDWYKFTSPRESGAVTVKLRVAGYSMLTGKITILDANQKELGSATSTGPGRDLSVTLSSPTQGATYFIKVESVASSPFKVGVYAVQIQTSSTAPVAASIAGFPVFEGIGINYTTSNALTLFDMWGDDRTQYSTIGAIKDSADYDYFKIKTPTEGINEKLILTATIKSLSDGTLPTVALFDASGAKITSNLIKASGTNYLVQLTGLQPNSDYFIRVNPNKDSLNQTYFLQANVRSAPETIGTATTDELAAGEKISYSLNLTGSTLSYFALSADSKGGQAVTMTVYNSSGAIVFDLYAQAGDTAIKMLLLAQGTYTIVVTGASSSASYEQGFSLDIASLSDPISLTASGGGSSGSGISGGSGSTSKTYPTSGSKI